MIKRPISPEVYDVKTQADMLSAHYGFDDAHNYAHRCMRQSDEEDIYLYWHDVASQISKDKKETQ